MKYNEQSIISQRAGRGGRGQAGEPPAQTSAGSSHTNCIYMFLLLSYFGADIGDMLVDKEGLIR